MQLISILLDSECFSLRVEEEALNVRLRGLQARPLCPVLVHVDVVLAVGEDEAPADVVLHPLGLAQPALREERGGQSLQGDVPACEGRDTLRTGRHVWPGPALATQTVALSTLVDGGGGRVSHLLLAVRTQQLSQDLVLQPDWPDLLMMEVAVVSSSSL